MKRICFVLFFFLGILFLIFLSRINLFGSQGKHNLHETKFPSAVLSKLQPADIILRSGKGFISDVFRQFSMKDKRYSHAGIVSVENNKIYVYHILGEESGNEQQLKKEPIEKFCNSFENSGFAVYRYDLQSIKKQKMLQKLFQWYRGKIKFDTGFNLATDSALYCTELIYKLTDFAAGDKNYLPVTIIDGNKYVAVDNLYMNAHSSLIYSQTY